jgi:alkylation response protein AidB-like acyl-CoA dehydrogenase
MPERSEAAQREWAVRRQADTLFSDLFLPEETRAIRAEARAFADRVLRPAAAVLNTTPERRDSFRHDIFHEIAKAGLFAIPFAKDVGGRELAHPTLASMMLLEELGYYSAAENEPLEP